MDSFPPEILHSIFIQLDLSERLLCTLVCRSWWRVLDSYSLLYNVTIRKSQQFKRFMDMIKRWPHRATQVEDLALHYCFNDNFNKRSFANTFPNLRIINMDCNLPHFHSTNPSESMETAKTTSKIQRICDNANCEYALQMMTYNLCGHLGTLDLDFNHLHISCHRILPQMKNMPVLKNLTLTTAHLSVADMEILHNNIPSIEKLNLISLLIRYSELPKSITPAPSLLETGFVNIEDADDIEAHARWYSYASKKYTTATTWHYNDEFFIDIDETGSQYIYENGMLEFLVLMASTQSKLSIYTIPSNINVFEFLDGRKLQLKDLSLLYCEGENVFQHLAQSNQSKYVEKLTLTGTEIGSFHHLQNFTVLTNLKLDTAFVDGSDLINLADLFNSLPDTLKELSLESENLRHYPMSCKSNSIERLNIISAYITGNTVDAALSCFPKLVHLSFCGSIVSNLKVTLQNPTLRVVRFSAFRPVCTFAYKHPSRPKSLYYSLKNGKITRVKYQDVKEELILSVESHIKGTVKLSYGSIIFTQND